MIYTAIDSFYLTDDQLRDSPSRKDDISEDVETTLRIYGCDLIQEAGILLKLGQAVMATAQVIFHRFYCKKSFAKFNVKRVSASCLWLAAKLEESPRSIRDVLNVFYRLNKRRSNLPPEPLDPFSSEKDALKTDLIRTERHLLKEMGFICHVEHPHKFIFNYLSQLEVDDPAVKQEAWNLANDSLRTTLCVRFKSEVVACGVIYAATRRAKIPLPLNPPWWLAFDATKAGIDQVCKALAFLYARPKAEYVAVAPEDKSFVLSSRAWEPVTNPEEGVKKSPAEAKDHQPAAVDEAEEKVNGAGQPEEALAEKEAEVGRKAEGKDSLSSRKIASKVAEIVEEEGATREVSAEERKVERSVTPPSAAKDGKPPASEKEIADLRAKIKARMMREKERKRQRSLEEEQDAYPEGDRERPVVKKREREEREERMERGESGARKQRVQKGGRGDLSPMDKEGPSARFNESGPAREKEYASSKRREGGSVKDRLGEKRRDDYEYEYSDRDRGRSYSGRSERDRGQRQRPYGKSSRS